MTFVLPFRLTPDQDLKNITNGTQQNFEAVTTALNTNSFKIVYSGTGTTPSVSISDGGAGVWSRAGSTTTAYAHGLGYTPAVMGFVYVGGNNIAMPYLVTDSSSSGATWTQYYITIDNSNVYLGTSVLGVHLALTVAIQAVKFYILQETAPST